LITTTTIILQIIYVYNPPKRIAKFKTLLLSSISSNTLLAGYQMLPILKIGEDLVQPWLSTALLETLSTLQHQCHHLPSPLLDQIHQSLPCRGMACPPHAITISLHLS
jgi:hypothetical protein